MPNMHYKWLPLLHLFACICNLFACICNLFACISQYVLETHLFACICKYYMYVGIHASYVLEVSTYVASMCIYLHVYVSIMMYGSVCTGITQHSTATCENKVYEESQCIYNDLFSYLCNLFACICKYLPLWAAKPQCSALSEAPRSCRRLWSCQ